MFPSSLSWAIQSIAFSSATNTCWQTDEADGHTMQLLYALWSNMFFAHLQEIKFPSKWISSSAAFGGRGTLFINFHSFHPKQMIYCTACSALFPSTCFSFLSSLPSCFPMLVNLGQQWLHCQKGVFWFMKYLKCYLVLLLFVSHWAKLIPKWNRALSVQCSIVNVKKATGRGLHIDTSNHCEDGKRFASETHLKTKAGEKERYVFWVFGSNWNDIHLPPYLINHVLNYLTEVHFASP